MGLVNVISGICRKCTRLVHGPDHKEKGVTCTCPFEVTRAIVTRPSPTGPKFVEVRDVFKCRECGEVVPIDTWRTYQKTGDIVIRKQRKGDQQW